jgi:hypothetical protein
MGKFNVAVIGAGVAGLACAERLRNAGCSIRLFDRAAAPGGRVATRRTALSDGGAVTFDHGAQFVVARDPDFAAKVGRWRSERVAELFPWPVFGHTGRSGDPGEPLYVGVGGMDALPRAMAKGLTVVLNRQVVSLSHGPGGWRLGFAGGSSEGGFDAAVIATPPDQAAQLLADAAPGLSLEAAQAQGAPCWAGMFAFEPGGEPAFGAIELEEDEPVHWLARTADGLGWVAHAGAEWSRLNLMMSPEAVILGLEASVRRILPGVGATLFAQAHRWRFARVESPAASPFVWDESLGLGLCGDWRLGPRVELAWRSGRLLGEAIGAGRRELNPATPRGGGALASAPGPGS